MTDEEKRRRKRRTYVGGGLSDSLLPIGYVADESDGVISFVAVLGGSILYSDLGNGILDFTQGYDEEDGVITL